MAQIQRYLILLNISYKDHVTIQQVGSRILDAAGEHVNFLTMVEKRTLKGCGYISRSTDMAKIILQGTVKGARQRGRQWQMPMYCCDVVGGAPTTVKVKGLRWDMLCSIFYSLQRIKDPRQFVLFQLVPAAHKMNENQPQTSRDMTRPTKWLCAQRRLRSAWASAQSDQSLRFALNG